MLTAVKNQIKVCLLSVKYGLIKQMANKLTFTMDVLFMILNNSSFIIQWIVLYSLKDNIGGYTLNQVLLLWGIAASTFGFAHFFFKKAFYLSDIITNGKLDSYLVQPKNVLLMVITSDVESSAIGDTIYGYLILFLTGITITKFLLFTIFTICGAMIITSIAVIFGSLSFWIGKSDTIADTGNNFITSFSTYPEGIFKGITKILLYTIIPVGFIVYIPVNVMSEFNLIGTLSVIGIATIITIFTFIIFYRGLKRYTSTNLMISKI